MEKILFFTSFLYVREKILTLLPPLLLSAKSLHFPVQFLLQFPAHTVVRKYVGKSQGRRRSLQTHTFHHTVSNWLQTRV